MQSPKSYIIIFFVPYSCQAWVGLKFPGSFKNDALHPVAVDGKMIFLIPSLTLFTSTFVTRVELTLSSKSLSSELINFSGGIVLLNDFYHTYQCIFYFCALDWVPFVIGNSGNSNA